MDEAITRKPEWTDEQARQYAAFDASRDPKEFLPEIYREASNAAQDPDGRISKTLAKCSALFVRLSDEQAKAAHRLDVYTRWLIGLTVALLVIAALQTTTGSPRGPNHDMVKLLGFASILSSVVGTAFVWFETKRIAYLLPSSEHLNLTKNAKFDAWYYGRAGLGFVLLLVPVRRVTECR